MLKEASVFSEDEKRATSQPVISGLDPQNLLDVIVRQPLSAECFFPFRYDQLIKEHLFVLLQLIDFLFDGSLRDETVNLHVFLLADAMRSPCRLLFDRRVPPKIEKDDRIRSGQIQPGAACFQGNQKDIGLAFIELVDQRNPFGRRGFFR